MNETFILLLLLGASSGFVAGLLGVGGGLIIVPILLYLLAPTVNQSVLMHTAIGTALAVMFLLQFQVYMRIISMEQYFGKTLLNSRLQSF